MAGAGERSGPATAGGRRARRVGYAEAERLAERLAELLLETVGDGVRQARFEAIPRGGWIVLGLLAYALRLDRAAAGEPESPAPLTVVVDDCALTGARFASTLARLSSPAVVFAHLLSHPDLRRSIRRREPRVVACLAADDLTAAGEGSEGEARRRAWARRLGPGRYWTGEVTPVAFAWSQPERLIWRPDERRYEGGWRAAEPLASFASRLELGLGAAARRGSHRLPAGVLWRAEDGGAELLRETDGRRFGLGEVELAMLRELLAEADRAASIERLAAAWAVPAERIERDLGRFARELVGEGLLEPAPAHGEGGDAG